MSLGLSFSGIVLFKGINHRVLSIASVLFGCIVNFLGLNYTSDYIRLQEIMMLSLSEFDITSIDILYIVLLISNTISGIFCFRFN